MKKWMMVALVLCLLLGGCTGQKEKPDAEPNEKEPTAAGTETTETNNAVTPEETPVPSETAPPETPALTVYPFPDTTMENLTDATLAVSFEEGDVYLDDTGKLQMNAKIYTYDIYSAADIAGLKVGDIVATHAGEVEVSDVARGDDGNVWINGGLEAGGFELAPGGGGTFYEIGYNDAKNWYEVGEATLRVSADFKGYDNADPDQGEVIIYPGDFLVDAVENYHFTPHNTTVRVAEGQIVELNRRYVP